MPDPARIPILVLSHDRPALLAETLAGLMDQGGAAAAAHPVFLLQDGGHNRASGRTYCSDRVILHNFDLFRRLVPHGLPLPAAENLGAALNLARAERIAFVERQADAAIFLTDDFRPGPWWLKTLHALIDLALSEPRIAMVAAGGDRAASAAAQRAQPSHLTTLGAARGYAVTRHAWQRLEPRLRAYWAVLAGQDFRLRDPAPIRALFAGWGAPVAGTGPGDAWAAACAAERLARVTTVAAHGRPIGPQGEDRAGAVSFGGPTVLMDDLFRLVPPGAEDLEAMITGRRAAPPTPAAPAVPPGAREALGRLRHLFNEARFDEAEALCVEWFARVPGWRDERGHPAYLKELTQLAIARGRLDQARTLADRLAAAIAPADPCVNLLFARAYARMGAEDAARAEWHAVLGKEPANAEARKALGAEVPG
ncbi:MAG: hypothetical protein J0I21_19135 [Alphaproteobacteria bacterium]|nr:hypothetical protein [Alphaproteobacteria bacterium]